jgi:transposase
MKVTLNNESRLRHNLLVVSCEEPQEEGGAAMAKSILKLVRPVKRRLQKIVRKARDAGEKTRAQIILFYAQGKRTREIAEAVGYHPSAVRKVYERFGEYGEVVIQDGRADNGQSKVDEDLLEALRLILAKTAKDSGFSRPTWTQPLLARALENLTRVRVSVSTMSRMLAQIKARWGMPKPVVGCPWPKPKKERRLQRLRSLVKNLPRQEVVVYEDEVDIHLNPRIGRDWMLRNTQREVPTPGQNQKYYLAGALNPKTGEMLWAGHERKNSQLFLVLMRKLAAAYPEAKRIHVILDNYSIHYSQIVQRALKKEFQGRIRLHFLPPYCPDHNAIERVWEDLHANVTRNHSCRTMKELLAEAHGFLERKSRELISRRSSERAAA